MNTKQRVKVRLFYLVRLKACLTYENSWNMNQNKTDFRTDPYSFHYDSISMKSRKTTSSSGSILLEMNFHRKRKSNLLNRFRPGFLYIFGRQEETNNGDCARKERSEIIPADPIFD